MPTLARPASCVPASGRAPGSLGDPARAGLPGLRVVRRDHRGRGHRRRPDRDRVHLRSVRLRVAAGVRGGVGGEPLMAPAARTPFPVDAISIKIHRSPFGMCWRWRTELAALVAGLAAWLRVSWWLARIRGRWPCSAAWSWCSGSCRGRGGSLAARFWCLFTRHRLQRVFWELRLHTRAGHLPWVLWTRPTTVGVRSWVLCPPGTCADDFRDSAKEIAAACGGAGGPRHRVAPLVAAGHDRRAAP